MRKNRPAPTVPNCNICPLLIVAQKLLILNENGTIITRLRLFQLKKYNLN